MIGAILAAFAAFFRTRLDLSLEVLALRQQLAVLKRKRRRRVLSRLRAVMSRFLRGSMRPYIRPALLLALGITAYAQLPPLIDRDAFFGEVKITAAQVSPDGKYISFLKPYNGTRNIWVKKSNEPFSAAKPVSAEKTRPIRIYFWTRDSKYVLYAQDQAGDENFNVYAIDPSAAPETATGVPAVRNLTNAKGSRAEIYSLPKTMPDVLYFGLNDRDNSWHDPAIDLRELIGVDAQNLGIPFLICSGR